VRGPLAPRVVAQLECLGFGPAYGQPKAALCWGANGTSLFAWNSKTYPSLSKVAFAITGFRPSSSPFEPSLYRLRSPLPGNGIFRAEKKVQHVPRTTDQRSQGPSGRTTTPLSRGLSPQPQEISATAGMRGGPGRIRISNQLVMNLPPRGVLDFFKGDQSRGARRRRPVATYSFFYNGCVQKCHIPNTSKIRGIRCVLASFWLGPRNAISTRFPAFFFPTACGVLIVPRLFLGARRGRVFPGARVVRAPSIAAVNLAFFVGPRREPERSSVAQCERGRRVEPLR